MRTIIALVAPLMITLWGAPAQAQQPSSSNPQTVKIGVLSDMSGLYADIGGPGSVVAAQMAVQDFNPASHHMKVESVSAKVLATIPAEQAFRPLAEERGICSLVKAASSQTGAR